MGEKEKAIIDETTLLLRTGTEDTVVKGEHRQSAEPRHELLYKRGHAYFKIACNIKHGWEINSQDTLQKALADFREASRLYYGSR